MLSGAWACEMRVLSGGYKGGDEREMDCDLMILVVSFLLLSSKHSASLYDKFVKIVYWHVCTLA